MFDCMSSNGINIILYPREYNKRGHESLHSVRGLTHSGTEVNVKLRLSEKYASYANAPKISELAKIDPRAKRYCIASPENSRVNREGVLLFSGAIKEPSKKSKIDTYVASWVEVLANSSDSPDPLLGYGRVEVNTSSKKINSIEKELKFHTVNNSSEEVLNSFRGELVNPKNYSYSAIFYMTDSIGTFGLKDKTRMKDFIIQSVSKNTMSGKIGGFLIRAYDIHGAVIKSSVREYFPRYTTVSSGVSIGKTLFEEKRTELSEILKHKEHVRFEVIPLQKVTTGPKSSEYYGEKDRYERIRRIFYPDGEPAVCKLIARTTEYIEDGTSLLYRAFPLSVSLGHPGKLSKDGVIHLRFQSESDNILSDVISSEELTERPVGPTNDTSVIKRAYWLLNECENDIELVKAHIESKTTIENNEVKSSSESSLNRNNEAEKALENKNIENSENKLSEESSTAQSIALIEELPSFDVTTYSEKEESVKRHNNAMTLADSKVGIKDKDEESSSNNAQSSSIQVSKENDDKSKDKADGGSKLTGMAAFLARQKNAAN